ncbi:UNVERIFIED_CONTAM: hypothetical protein FKN15_063141 [Acipenser sinensis]
MQQFPNWFVENWQVIKEPYDLFEEGKSPSTFKGPSVSYVKIDSVSPGDQFLAGQFFKGTWLLRPPMKDIVPRWRLNVVLDALMKPPFEPLHSAELKFLSLAITSTKRVLTVLQQLAVRPQSPVIMRPWKGEATQASKAAKPFGCGYPSLQPAYQQTPYSTNSQSSNPSNPPGNQQNSQASKAAKPFGCGYPSLQPAYQQTPYSTNSQSSNPSNPPGNQQNSQPYPTMCQLSAALGGLSLPAQQLEALRPVNLMQERNILPSTEVQAPVPNLSTDLKKANCRSDSFRCTLTNIPQTQALLNKAKLPLGLLLHPFRDLTQLPVITSNTIVRCRSCRTYINPFVSFLDQRRWKCNLCYRVNDVPEEFMYNPLTRSYGEPHKRPEVQNSTVEFIASSDYMLRPPQPAVYLFVLDVSHNAVEAGYLNVLCQSLLENLDKLPGDTRTRVGFITFDSTIHFYNLQEGLSQPQMLVVSDIDGGRVSVFQTQLPSLGAGLLHSREDPNQRSSTKVVQHLGPATDFYKKLALDCSGQQIAVDLFLLSSQYSDLASLGKRRIRVHTLCLPVVSQLNDVFAGADVQAITCLLANMAVDRAISSNLTDSRDALVNAVVDSLSAYRSTTSILQQSGVIAPYSLRLFPLYVLALLKQKALRTGTSTRLDDRVFAMCEFKCQPLQQIMRRIHPNLYRIDNLTDEGALHVNDSIVPQPPILQLSAERLTREGAFLMDCGSVLYLWVGKSCDVTFISDVLGYPNHASIQQNMNSIRQMNQTRFYIVENRNSMVQVNLLVSGLPVQLNEKEYTELLQEHLAIKSSLLQPPGDSGNGGWNTRPPKRVPANPSFFALWMHSEATRPIVPEDNTDLMAQL